MIWPSAGRGVAEVALDGRAFEGSVPSGLVYFTR